MKEEIIIQNIPITIFRKKMKNINLRIKDNGAVTVSAPKFVSQKQICQFVESKIDWLKKHLEKIKANPQTNFVLASGSTFFVFDKPYTLKLAYGAKRNKMILQGESTAVMFMKPNSTQKDCQKFFDSWKKKNLQKILPQFFEKWSKITHLTVNGFSVRDMKTRWGSCNTKKHTISINSQIFHKPLCCLDYLVLHEIAHIYEPSHSARFKNFLTQYMPTWREKRRLLKYNEK